MKTTKAFVLAAYLATAAALLSHRAAAHGEHEHGHQTFAAGEPGDPTKPARHLAVIVNEGQDGTMKFVPDTLDVKVGEQVWFDVKNTGKAVHEFMLDTVERNAKHKLVMQKNPEMEHDDANGKTLEAGASGWILWRFSKTGTFEFACLIPGHHEAGMHGAVTVHK